LVAVVVVILLVEHSLKGKMVAQAAALTVVPVLEQIEVMTRAQVHQVKAIMVELVLSLVQETAAAAVVVLVL
jgi:hypothetical protein